MAEFAFMEHPELTDRVIKVPVSAVPVHAASGWTLVEGDKQEKAAAEKVTKDEAKALRPSADSGAVDPDTVDKVTARRAGKE